MNRPPPIMEPEDEIRRLREECDRLRDVLDAALDWWHADTRRAPGREPAWVNGARAILNPAKSAAPFSPG